MFKFLRIIAIACTVSLVQALEYVPGRMIITIKLEHDLQLSRDQSGFIKTGIPNIDKLNEYFGVVSYEPLLGTLGKFEEKWRDFRNHLIFFFADTFINVEEVSKLYDALPEVRDAHPEYLKPYMRTPNDPMYFTQWYLQKCELPRAWDFTIGRADGLLITAIDSGLDWDHPEIMPIVWVNPGEDLDGDGVVFDYDDINLVDDDWNGLVDDLIGYDFVDGARNAYRSDTLNEDGMVIDNDPSDFILNGHGTMCTGLFLAATNNNFGLASTNWAGKTIALRAGYYSQDSMGYNLPSAMVRATRYAIDMGAKIISLSYGSFRPDPEERDIINAAWNAGCIVIAAAGNETTSARIYPAAYPNVIAVGATNISDIKTDFSNYGSYVDIMAPGERLYMVYPDGFQTADGTSFSAPLVAGIARLIWSYFPDSSRDWVISRLLDSADPIDSLNPDSLHGKLGVGRVNAYKAIAQVLRPNIRFLEQLVTEEAGGNGDGRVDPGETGILSFKVHNELGWRTGTNVTFSVSFLEEDSTVLFINNTVSVTRIAPGETVTTPPIRFRVSVDAQAHRLYLRLIIRSSEGFYDSRYLPFIMIGRPNVLIYNASGDTILNRYFTRVLDRGSIVYDLYQRTKDSTTVEIISESELQKYRTVIWFTGTRTDSTVLPEEQRMLTNFLYAGKQLIITGQNIGDDIGTTSFFTDILKAIHTDNNVGRRFMRVEGIDGDPIGDTIRFFITGGDGAGNQDSPSGVRPAPGAYPCFKYMGDTTSNRYAGIRYEDTRYGYKVVYLAFGFEAINSQVPGYTSAKNVMARIFWWLGYEFTEIKEPETNSSIRLPEIKAYPNPFNSEITVEFTVPSFRYVKYEIYDITGRLVERKGLGGLSRGTYRVNWSNPPTSGIYLMVIDDGVKKESIKLIHMK